MLKINRLKKIKSNFPVLVGDKVVEKNTCNSLIDEISKSKAFDDMIMGGRSRINKGSKNFNNYIKFSNNSAKEMRNGGCHLSYGVMMGVSAQLRFCVPPLVSSLAPLERPIVVERRPQQEVVLPLGGY